MLRAVSENKRSLHPHACRVSSLRWPLFIRSYCSLRGPLSSRLESQ
jgi:hypothetical protein